VPGEGVFPWGEGPWGTGVGAGGVARPSGVPAETSAACAARFLRAVLCWDYYQLLAWQPVLSEPPDAPFSDPIYIQATFLPCSKDYYELW